MVTTLSLNIMFNDIDDFARMLGFVDMEEAKEVMDDPTPEKMICNLAVPWTKKPVVVAVMDEVNVGPVRYPKLTRIALVNNLYGIGNTLGMLLIHFEDQGPKYFDKDTMLMIRGGFWCFAERYLTNDQYENFWGVAG